MWKIPLEQLNHGVKDHRLSERHGVAFEPGDLGRFNLPTKLQ
jgi:hypothetical protein